MHIKELDLNLLIVMDTMLREKSVSKAAQRLGLTQSATSHALNRLRHYFDDPLFIKTGSSMEPTAKALALQAAVIDVIGTVRQKILSEAHFDPLTARKEFIFCVTDMAELVFMPKLLKLFRTHAPNCSIRTMQVQSEQIEGLLSRGEADLALGTYRTAPKGIYKQRLFMHGFTTLVHINSRVKKRITLSQFEETDQIVVSLSGMSMIPFDNVLEEKGIRRRIVMRTPHFLVVPMLIEQQPDLIATIPSALGHSFDRFGFIRAVEPPLELPSYAISQYWHPIFHHEPALIWLRDLIKRNFENYPKI